MKELTKNEQEFMSNFSLPLIHKIMLTDPNDFSKLTMDGLPRVKQIYFHSFVKSRGFPIHHAATATATTTAAATTIGSNANATNVTVEEQITKTMHRAYNDMILHQMEMQSANENANEDASEQKNPDQTTTATTATSAPSTATSTTTSTDSTTTSTTENENKSDDDSQSQNQSDKYNYNYNNNYKYNYKPIQSMIQEIHSMIKSLIPNRKDLHQLLEQQQPQTKQQSQDNDNDNGTTNNNGKDNDNDNDNNNPSFQIILNQLQIIGNALCLLESEYRMESTKQWMDVLLSVMNMNIDIDKDRDVINERNEIIPISTPPHGVESEQQQQQDDDDNDDDDNKNNNNGITLSYASFALASVTFLHYKAELCHADKADFQLSHILAPKIYHLGHSFLYTQFETKFTSTVSHPLSTTTATTPTNCADGNTTPTTADRSNNNNTTNSINEPNNNNNNDNVLPNTKMWIKEMIQNTSYTKEELLSSETKRGHVLLQTGWIDNILFRSPRSVVNNDDENETVDDKENQTASSSPSPSSSTQFLMPEVLWLDIPSIRQIRMTTKLSVVGSVLALHATSAAGVNAAVLHNNNDDSNDNNHRHHHHHHHTIVEECRMNLISAMNNSHRVSNQDLYESNIGRAVVELAKALNPSMIMTNDDEQSLRNRCKATIKGEDPVIKLLDNRMRDIFRRLVVSNPQTKQQVPTSIRTGRDLSFGKKTTETTTTTTTFDSLFKQAAKQEFAAKGFAFYSKELAEASLVACRRINLVLSIYGHEILEKIFVSTCSSSKNES